MGKREGVGSGKVLDSGFELGTPVAQLRGISAQTAHTVSYSVLTSCPKICKQGSMLFSINVRDIRFIRC